MRWSLSNGSFEMLVRYGDAYINAPFRGSSIKYDYLTENLVITGLVANATTSPYGGWDGIVLIYDKHLNLTDTIIVGGSGDDLGSTIALPYILISAVTPVHSSFGVGVSGPGLLNLSLQAASDKTTSSKTLTTTTTLL